MRTLVSVLSEWQEIEQDVAKQNHILEDEIRILEEQCRALDAKGRSIDDVGRKAMATDGNLQFHVDLCRSKALRATATEMTLWQQTLGGPSNLLCAARTEVEEAHTQLDLTKRELDKTRAYADATHRHIVVLEERSEQLREGEVAARLDHSVELLVGQRLREELRECQDMLTDDRTRRFSQRLFGESADDSATCPRRRSLADEGLGNICLDSAGPLVPDSSDRSSISSESDKVYEADEMQSEVQGLHMDFIEKEGLASEADIGRTESEHLQSNRQGGELLGECMAAVTTTAALRAELGAVRQEARETSEELMRLREVLAVDNERHLAEADMDRAELERVREDRQHLRVVVEELHWELGAAATAATEARSEVSTMQKEASEVGAELMHSKEVRIALEEDSMEKQRRLVEADADRAELAQLRNDGQELRAVVEELRAERRVSAASKADGSAECEAEAVAAAKPTNPKIMPGSPLACAMAELANKGNKDLEAEQKRRHTKLANPKICPKITPKLSSKKPVASNKPFARRSF